jgi:uncharacterized membrane protein
MKICPNCGISVADDMSFCNNCGASLTDVAPAAETVKLASAQGASDKNSASQAAPEQSAANTAAPVQTASVPNSSFQNGPAPQVPVMQPVMQQNYQQGAYGQPQGQPYMQQPYQAYDPKDHTSEFDPKDIADNKLYAVVPYLFSFIVGIIVGIYVNESQFLRFHIKNALRLDVASVIVALFFIIPVLGWAAGGICLAILFVIKIIAIVNALSGKAKELPIISSIGFLK